MLTPKDLEAIGILVRAEVNTLRKDMATKEDIKEIVAGSNRIVSTLLKVEITTATNNIIKAVKAGFQETAAHMKKLSDKDKDHENRILELEGKPVPRSH